MQVLRVYIDGGYRLGMVEPGRKWARVVCFDSSCVRARKVPVAALRRAWPVRNVAIGLFGERLRGFVTQYNIPMTQEAERLLQAALDS